MFLPRRSAGRLSLIGIIPVGPRFQRTPMNPRAYVAARKSVVLSLAVLCSGGLELSSPRPVSGSDWPEFRGPRGDGHASSTQLPKTWSEQQHVRFKAKVPGLGWSTPVVHENQVWLTKNCLVCTKDMTPLHSRQPDLKCQRNLSNTE